MYILNDDKQITPSVDLNYLKFPFTARLNQPIKIELKYPTFFGQQLRVRVCKICITRIIYNAMSAPFLTKLYKFHKRLQNKLASKAYAAKFCIG